ncbi:MAG: amidohydrolase family protein [Pseudomonadales bacterium]|nr:amidohydrolase family protein [Pseudomonadales bacterium]
MTAQPDARTYKRIATEEAWAPSTMLEQWRRILQKKSFDDPGFQSLWGFFLQQNVGYTNDIIARLQDLGERRLGDMDAAGIDQQLLLLTAPGVQVFDRDDAVAIARASNDEVSEACHRHPERFAALAAVAPQDPKEAAREIDRAVNKLGLNGIVINSHTHGEYLDDPKFWDIFEAAEALDAAIYIHPQTPPKDMVNQFLKRNLDGAIMGFSVEVALHTVAIVLSGAFERFPKLKIVIGHAGEGLPFWLYRLDCQQDLVLGSMGENKLKRKISDYIKENVYVTTSGMGWEPAILFIQQIMGVDHVLYAMDYPFQYVMEEVATTDNLPISAEDRLKLYQSNAQRLFHLR